MVAEDIHLVTPNIGLDLSEMGWVGGYRWVEALQIPVLGLKHVWISVSPQKTDLPVTNYTRSYALSNNPKFLSQSHRKFETWPVELPE